MAQASLETSLRMEASETRKDLVLSLEMKEDLMQELIQMDISGESAEEIISAVEDCLTKCSPHKQDAILTGHNLRNLTPQQIRAVTTQKLLQDQFQPLLREALVSKMRKSNQRQPKQLPTLTQMLQCQMRKLIKSLTSSEVESRTVGSYLASLQELTRICTVCKEFRIILAGEATICDPTCMDNLTQKLGHLSMLAQGALQQLVGASTRQLAILAEPSTACTDQETCSEPTISIAVPRVQPRNEQPEPRLREPGLIDQLSMNFNKALAPFLTFLSLGTHAEKEYKLMFSNLMFELSLIQGMCDNGYNQTENESFKLYKSMASSQFMTLINLGMNIKLGNVLDAKAAEEELLAKLLRTNRVQIASGKTPLFRRVAPRR
ncbi:TPA_asm: hypothetical protein [Apostichopus japonicus associated picornavirus 2]|nr:TPA_asm: hypothetical protein [Apostichopus japonicus associated picornavirus 2]